MGTTVINIEDAIVSYREDIVKMSRAIVVKLSRSFLNYPEGCNTEVVFFLLSHT